MSGYTIGIDPGVTGAIAIIGPQGTLFALDDMPLITERNNKKHINVAELAAILRRAGSHATVKIERVNAMPAIGQGKGQARRTMGATSAFNFGRNFGTLIGIIGTLGIPLEQVTPASWKKAAGITGTPKDYARTRALELYPDAELHLKKHVGRADAILIARYG